jgi:fatty-acyl-CoA synthase
MAGSPCPIKVMQDVIDKMHMTEITIAYGQTESSPVCTQTTADDSIERRVHTVGKTLPFMETKIVDPETGEKLGTGQPGEFCVRGYNVMKGYYKLERETKETIDNEGWLHTGDLTTVDENGYYKITGRIKDLIIRGGENIFPKEIEDFLYTHEAISDVAIVAVPSERYGEEVCAYVILKKDMQADEEDIRTYVANNMAQHKVPRYVIFTESFPLTASGKIQKYKMRDEAIKLLNLEAEAQIETA